MSYSFDYNTISFLVAITALHVSLVLPMSYTDAMEQCFDEWVLWICYFYYYNYLFYKN